ncbi:MAG: hypothetical protein ABJH98_15005 [Reichenbachiella sp.]|uniref:hypothetical protein n=1 Tax=Reichenbachiella sp. TaxID=2184521 RepID=UPI00329A7F47
MLKSILSALVFITTATTLAYSQNSIAPELKSTQVRVTILALGISVEQKLADKHSINLIAGLQPGVATYTLVPDGTQYEFYIAPFVTGEIRSYYNRKSVKKELGPNSGNYFALAAGYYMDRIINDTGRDYYDESYENSFFVGPVWGIQRNYKTGFHLNLSIGLGYQQGDYLEGAVRIISNGGIGLYF